MRTLALDRINVASLLALGALIFLFLVVLGLGRPAFAAGHMHVMQGSSRATGVMAQPCDAVGS